MTTQFTSVVPGQPRRDGNASGQGLSRRLELAAQLVLSENQQVLSSVSWTSVENLVDLISCTRRVFVLGEGRSGLAIRMAAMRLMHLGGRVHVVGETTTPAMAGDDVLIAVSGSGGTPGVVAAAKQAGTVGGRLAAVTAVASSPLAAIADLVVPIPAASKHERDSENSAQFAGSLFEQATVLLFDAVFHTLSRELGKTADTLWSTHANLE
jgi:6-phospho-3-hexuloisomerase